MGKLTYSHRQSVGSLVAPGWVLEMGNVLLGLLLSIPALTLALGAHPCTGIPQDLFQDNPHWCWIHTLHPTLVEGSTFPSGPIPSAGKGLSQQWWSLVLVPVFLGLCLPAHGKISSLCLLPCPSSKAWSHNLFWTMI